jgi:hypothetical protein
MEGAEVGNAVVVEEIRHLRISQRSIIGQGFSSLNGYFFRPVQVAVEEMYLSPRFQIGETPVKDLFQRRKVLDRSSENDAIEQAVAEYSRSDIPVDEMQVRVIVEHPGGLLQLGEIDVETGDFGTAYLRQLMGEPAIAASHLQYLQRSFFGRKIAKEVLGGSSAKPPFLAMDMVSVDIGQLHQVFIGVQPAFQAPGVDISLFKQDIPEVGMARDLDVCQYRRIGEVHVELF